MAQRVQEWPLALFWVICYPALRMKTEIHPTYFPKAQMICACGNIMTLGSTKEEIHVEVCSKCHPFYTGKQNLVDTGGRIERFAQKSAKASSSTATAGKKVKAVKRAAQKVAKRT